MTPQSTKQRERCRDLYKTAKLALDFLAEERLNLGSDTRACLDETRGSLEQFDYWLSQQPINDALVEGVKR
jgi:hypothetical protein